MKKTIVRFEIDHSRYITFEFYGAVKDLHLLDYITIAYHENRKKYILFTDGWVAGSLREDFELNLAAALKGQMVIHESIDRDLGFLWSEYFENKTKYNFVKKQSENSTFWVGLKNLVLSSLQWETWLYNKDGDIYLEITPVYKWHHLRPKKNEKYIPYSKFIKNYKPLAIIKLDKKVVQHWFEVITKLVKIAQKNYDRWAREEEKRVKHPNYYQEVYVKGNSRITAQLYGHNGGFWKMFNGRKRLGIFDKTLKNRIGN